MKPTFDTIRSARGFIFDCDGTLVDSEVISIRILAEYLGELGWPVSVEYAVANYAGRDLHECMRDAEQAIGRPLPPDAIEIFRGRQIPMLKRDLRPIPGVDELLESLTVPFCVASNAPQEKIRVCLDTTNLRRHFADDRIFSAYDIERWKPDPALFELAADRLRLPPERCVVVEDSIYGIEASLAAGTQTVIHDKFAEFDDRTLRIEHLEDLRRMIANP